MFSRSSTKPDRINKIYEILAEREYRRLEYARSTSQTSSPEQTFYSIRCSADNRYSNINAYDRTAIRLDGGKGEYVHANVVQDGKGGEWIASQAPPRYALPTFFKALFTGATCDSGLSTSVDNQHRNLPNSVIVVQLTGWEENGILKADLYLPKTEYTLPDGLKVKHESRTELSHLSTILTELRLVDESRDVVMYHYHFSGWRDHSVPQGDNVVALKSLILEIKRRRQELNCQVWVHCSAGVGRTGSFIALSSLLKPGIPKQPSYLEPLPKSLSEDRVAQTVDAIRECRPMLVQNVEQLKLIYQLVDQLR